jgi:hypothetical protein
MAEPDYYTRSHHEAASKFFVQQFFRLEIHHPSFAATAKLLFIRP